MDKENRATSKQIYECTLRVLETEGPEAVSMRRVAKEVGITPMAIYHHFSNREALLDAVVESEFEHLVQYFSAPSRNRSFEASMIHIMDGYISYALAHPRIFDYVFSALRPGSRRFPEDFREGRSPTLNVVFDIVSTWMKAGKLKRDDAWEICMDLWAHAHGYLALWRGGRFQLTEDQFRKLVHRSLRRLLYGLAS